MRGFLRCLLLALLITCGVTASPSPGNTTITNATTGAPSTSGEYEYEPATIEPTPQPTQLPTYITRTAAYCTHHCRESVLTQKKCVNFVNRNVPIVKGCSCPKQETTCRNWVHRHHVG